MATQLFFRTGIGTYCTGTNDANLRGTNQGWTSVPLATTRGSSASAIPTNTVTGPTAGVEVLNRVWYSEPIDADITISGSITWNLWANENNMSANVAINGLLEVIDGKDGTITLIDQTARVTELGTSSAAANFAETPAAGVACKRGDRLRVRVFGDDAGTMATGYTFTFTVGGPTGGADGDSYLTLTETLSFATPAGSQVFLTDTASSVATASVDREAWTSRGAGVQTDVLDTVAGWTAPLQITDTAGGTVVDWFTQPLQAFTLGGAVGCNTRGLQSAAGVEAASRIEISIVDNDGTNPVLWAAGTCPYATGTTESIWVHSVSGGNVSVAAGKRLRIRWLIDEGANLPMVGARTVTTYYAGTSAAASGDTYLTFTQTLVEEVAAVVLVPYFRPYPQLLAH